jgi:hypothetical protein
MMIVIIIRRRRDPRVDVFIQLQPVVVGASGGREVGSSSPEVVAEAGRAADFPMVRVAYGAEEGTPAGAGDGDEAVVCKVVVIIVIVIMTMIMVIVRIRRGVTNV